MTSGCSPATMLHGNDIAAAALILARLWGRRELARIRERGKRCPCATFAWSGSAPGSVT